jgi:hypothetical protein
MGFDAAGADEVRTAAEKTAAHGASLAEAAGFRTQSMAAEAAPTWAELLAFIRDDLGVNTDGLELTGAALATARDLGRALTGRPPPRH